MTSRAEGSRNRNALGSFTTGPRDVNPLHIRKGPTVLGLWRASQEGPYYTAAVVYQHVRFLKTLRTLSCVFAFCNHLVISNVKEVARFARWLIAVGLHLDTRLRGLMIGPERTDWTIQGLKPRIGLNLATAVRRRVVRATVSSAMLPR